MSAIFGSLAGGVALRVADLFAAFAGGAAASPVIPLGSAGVTLTSEWLKEFAIRYIGTNDKLVLLIGLGAGAAVFVLIIGIVARIRLMLGLAGLAGLAVFGIIGAIAAVTLPNAGVAAAVPSVVGVLVGMAVFVLLVRAAAPAKVQRSPAESADPKEAQAGADRRELLLTGPFVTSNKDFHRVDTALTLPQVSSQDWILRIHGMVDHPVELSVGDRPLRPMRERDITLCRVSNQFSGRYVGNTGWVGASLVTLLRQAGLRSGADQILSRSADGSAISTRVEMLPDT
ncbi:molybdopterin-dependent oxidoreductase [Actinoallomurus bryophytorum]|uniref:molybdopterin-dependent oxidoreductase n=1 Tax=Actinoallomurus bryophytorum TaxID=1490222 RepID=UPI001FE89E1E|nr:molybdopterin-dependent oxidoreductase [Actinoallomurus bryophytorum]